MVKHETLQHALLAAKAEFPPIGRTGEGKVKGVGKKGPYEYTYKYATIHILRSVCDPVLTKHGLYINHAPDIIEGKTVLRTLLTHADSGQEITALWDISDAKGDQQNMGANKTYAERYCYTALLGIAAEDDDDAKRTSGARKPPKKKPTNRKAPEGGPPPPDQPPKTGDETDFDKAKFVKIYRDKIGKIEKGGVFQTEEQRLAFNKLHTEKEHTADFTLADFNILFPALSRFITAMKGNSS